MSYKVLKGINWVPPGGVRECRAEAGDTIPAGDFKESSVKAFKKMGAIVEVKDKD